MTTQPTMFGYAVTTTAQPELFANDGKHLDRAERCPECLEPLVLTPNGYIACPMGHGRLIEQTNDAPAEADAFDLWALAEGLTT